jgi:hypothetical protein
MNKRLQCIRNTSPQAGDLRLRIQLGEMRLPVAHQTEPGEPVGGNEKGRPGGMPGTARFCSMLGL